MSLENKDFVARIQRIAEALAAIADEKTPEVIEEFGDDALSQVERQVNHAIRALDHRLQERVLFSIGPCIVFRWRNTAASFLTGKSQRSLREASHFFPSARNAPPGT